MFNNNFSDKNKFKLLTRNEYAEDKNYKIVEEKYMNIDNNCEIIRKLRFKNIYKDIKVRLTQSQIDCINERLKWDKFGSELTTPAEIKKGDDEFIHYNPEILKSKKSKKYIEENNMSSYIEPIFLDSNSSLEDLMIQDEKLYDLLKDNQTKYLQKCKTERLEFLENLKQKEKEKEKKKYVRPSQRKPKNPNEIKSLKITNIGDVDDYGEKYLYNFFKSFNISRFKLYIPKHKDTNKLKNICFLNFNNNQDAGQSLENLQNKRLENSILCVEWAKY